MKITISTLLVLFTISTIGQNVSTKQIRESLNGKWMLKYKEDGTSVDSSVAISKVVLKLKGRKGKEIGYFKSGRKMKSKISWKFSRPDGGGNNVVLFKGGFWVDDQDFSIVKISSDTIFMKSCDKYECEDAYLIRQN